MRVRVIEVSPDLFRGQRLDALAREWRFITVADADALFIKKLVDEYVSRVKSEAEFNKRVKEGKHIIEEWTVQT